MIYKNSFSKQPISPIVGLPGCWTNGLLGKCLIPEKLQPQLENAISAGFSIFFNSKNAILTISAGLTTMPQTQRRSYPIVHSQIRKLEHVGVLNLER